METDKPVLNAQDVADLLDVHVETVRRLARRQAIPSFKIGKDWRFKRDMLLQWMETHHRTSRPPHILVIDDEPGIRRLIRRHLEPEGIQVLTAGTGSDGLELVRKDTVDLVLLDLFMPLMNGPEFIRELRKTHPALPVIIVTGYPDSGLIMEAYAHGPVMLIPKPVEKKALLSAVRITLEGTLAEPEAASIS